MNFFERIKKIFGNRKTQEENSINYEEGSQETYNIYHEDEEIQILNEISALAKNIQRAFLDITPDEQTISEYTNALKMVKSEVDRRGIIYEKNTNQIFGNFINKLQLMYDSEKKEPVNYDKLKEELEDDLKLKWEFATGDEEIIWRHFCQFNYNDFMNPTKLKASIKKKIDECYELLGDECLDKDFGELAKIRNEFAKLLHEWDKIVIDYSKIISEMIIRSDYKVNDEELKKYYEFLTIQPQLQEMQTNSYEVFQFILQNNTEKRLEKYSKDDIFMKKLQIIMEHDKEKHNYLFHGTQVLEDSPSILKSGLLMMREDLASTTAEEFTEEELLLYERRRHDGKHWNRICCNS